MRNEARCRPCLSRRNAFHFDETEFAVKRERERTRNGRCGHYDGIRAFGLVFEFAALRDSEPMLLVRNYERKRVENHVVAEQRVRSERQACRAAFEICESFRPRRPVTEPDKKAQVTPFSVKNFKALRKC